MTTKILLPLVILIAVLGGSYVYYTKQKDNIVVQTKVETLTPQMIPTEDPKAEYPTVFVGILRPSGLLQDQIQKMHLYPDAQIVVTQPFTIKGTTYNFAYLGDTIANDSFPPTAYVSGKCARVEGTIDPLSINDSQTYYGESTFGGVVLPEGTVQPVALEECRNAFTPKDKPTTEGFESFEVAGVISSINRPAPDIEYDYIIDSPSAIKGVMDMSGLSDEKNSVVVVPANFDVYKAIEESLGKPVLIKGYLQWGYAESQFFTAEEVTAKQ